MRNALLSILLLMAVATVIAPQADQRPPQSMYQYTAEVALADPEARLHVLELDHRVLLPTEHKLIRVAAEGDEVEVTFDRRRWSLPRSDCLLLPIPNTTTELLARYLGERLLDELAARTGTRPTLVNIEVEESPGFSAVCRLCDE